MFKGLMTGISGIRGVVGEGMTPEVALLWAGGFATWLKGGKVIVAMDSRPTGIMIKHAVLAALSAAGCAVDDIGVSTTPAAALTVERRGAAGGIIITASHNPQEWNAMKFVRADGRMLTVQDYNQLERIVSEGPLRSVAWNRLGEIREWRGTDAMYIESVTGLGILDLHKIHGKRFKVAIDCVNASGSRVYPDLLSAFGCEVVSINTDGTGIFTHPPEPVPENIKELADSVVAEKCAVGFAVDPDGDRLAVVDEKGTPIGEELTLALSAKVVLKLKPGPVVVNSLTSQVMEDIAREFGVECFRTRVGEANVASRMLEVGAVIGGEGNGGVIYPELHLVRDAGVGMAHILNLLAISKKTISANVQELPSYKMIKSSVPVGIDDPEDLLERVVRLYSHDQISRIDGVRVVSEDGWVQVRPSNTEPILRVFAEAGTIEDAQRLSLEMLDKIEKSRTILS